VLKARQAFPPGHSTTRLCLELLTEAVAQAPGAPVLDVGCGSGILALAAAALGAPFCVGVDLSRSAVRITRENAIRNNLEERVLVAQGSTECLRGSFKLIIANLPSGVQAEKVREFSRLSAPGAGLILSGFKDTQEAELLALYREAGWSRNRRLSRDEWVIELPPEKSFTWVAWRLKRV
jgi:ribosomal protein L11 methyltransferase